MLNSFGPQNFPVANANNANRRCHVGRAMTIPIRAGLRQPCPPLPLATSFIIANAPSIMSLFLIKNCCNHRALVARDTKEPAHKTACARPPMTGRNQRNKWASDVVVVLVCIVRRKCTNMFFFFRITPHSFSFVCIVIVLLACVGIGKSIQIMLGLVGNLVMFHKVSRALVPLSMPRPKVPRTPAAIHCTCIFDTRPHGVSAQLVCECWRHRRRMRSPSAPIPPSANANETNQIRRTRRVSSLSCSRVRSILGQPRCCRAPPPPPVLE